MYWTLERLLMIAVVMTLVCMDGVYRAHKQHREEKISKRLYIGYLIALGAGSGLAWLGVLMKWLS